jgi:GNAT superfamily N-acetyltransferase
MLGLVVLHNARRGAQSGLRPGTLLAEGPPMCHLVRAMQRDDIPAVDAMLRRAFQVSFSQATRLAEHLEQPRGRSFLAEFDGSVAGVVFGNDYRRRAYVSLMGVDPQVQRRGIATALLEALLDWARDRSFRDVRLDATPAGARLYERLGFADVDRTLVFVRELVTPVAAIGGVRRASPADRARILALDAVSLNADREPIIVPLVAGRPTFIADAANGYAVLQARTDGVVVGPLIADDAMTAHALLLAALAAAAPGWAFLYVPASNLAVVELARATGFREQRSLRHMVRGESIGPGATLFGRVNLGQG